MIRFTCLALDCTQRTDSCAKRHLQAIRYTKRGAYEYGMSPLVGADLCARCPVGAHLAEVHAEGEKAAA